MVRAMRYSRAGLCALVLVGSLVTAAAMAAALSRDYSSFDSPASFYDAWKIKKWAGTVHVDFLDAGGAPGVEFQCPSSSWAFFRRVDVDLNRSPILSWRWRADALPPGGDGRRRETDDEAAQVYLLFPGEGLFGALNYRVLGYTWETEPAAGTFYISPKTPNLRIFVLRSKQDRLGVWTSERRDVAADFRAAFGRAPLKPVAISIQIDSENTKSFARSAFSGLTFSTR